MMTSGRSASVSAQRGITLVESLVAVVIGLGVLGAAAGFFIQTSRSIKMGQDSAENTAVAQQLATTPAWDTLPALPYTAKELYPYPSTAGVVIDPAYPAARWFGSQSASDIYHKWYPNPDGGGSNSLVFYKAVPPGPGGTSTIERVSYRLDSKNQLIKEVQRPLLSTSTSFQSSPTPERTVLAKEVQSIAFTYPVFERQMNAALDTQLTAMQTAQGAAATQSFISDNYRKIIGIRVVMQGPRIGNKNKPGIELETEVRLRSE